MLLGGEPEKLTPAAGNKLPESGGGIVLTNAPCINCKDRQEKCHASCERYKTWKEKKDKENIQERQVKEKAWMLTKQHTAAVEKALKRRKK